MKDDATHSVDGAKEEAPTVKRFLPRQMDFESLIKVLAEEHAVMEAGLARIELSAGRLDFAGVAATLAELDPIFRQHIADEESQILRLLIRELGVTGAEEEIKVFQQHRPIHKLMLIVAELAAKSAGELAGDQRQLNELFLEHASMEERGVFPKALGIYRKQGERQATERI